MRYVQLSLLFLLVSCATNFKDGPGGLAKIEEYQDLIKVESLPEPQSAAIEPSKEAGIQSASELKAKTGASLSSSKQEAQPISPDKSAVNQTVGVKDSKSSNSPVAANATISAKTTLPISNSKKIEKVKSAKKSKDKSEVPVVKGPRKPKYEDNEGFNDLRRPAVDPFVPGESVVFNVEYLGVTAGQLGLKVENYVQVNSKKAYKFSGFIKSSDYYNMIFKVDNTAEAYVDFESLLPLSEELHINDSKERREARSIFKHAESKAIYWHKAENKDGEKDERKHEWKTEEYTQGAMSVLFYLRNFVLRPGKVLKFNLANRNKNIPMQIEVLKREELVTKIGKFKALKLRASVKNDGKLQQTGHSYFWVSDDDRKMILQFEFRLKIGTLYGKLDSLKL